MNCTHMICMNLQPTNVHKRHFYVSLQNLDRLFLEVHVGELIYLTSKKFPN